MKNRKILAVLVLGAVMAFAGACGKSPAASTQAQTQVSTEAQTSSEAQTQTADEEIQGIEGSVTGTIEELKDFMLIIDAEDGNAYPIPFDEKPEGYDDLKVGDKVKVTFTGTLNAVDAFNGEITSIEKVQ